MCEMMVVHIWNQQNTHCNKNNKTIQPRCEAKVTKTKVRASPPSTLKVHAVAIAANHAPETGLSISRHNLVKFLREARRLNPPRHQPGTCPQSLGSFKALVSSHFSRPSYSPWQRLVSVKWDGDLQDLSVCAACSEFGPSDCRVF